jgi:CxxC motif-containing protein (DUF1111 family)
MKRLRICSGVLSAARNARKVRPAGAVLTATLIVAGLGVGVGLSIFRPFRDHWVFIQSAFATTATDSPTTVELNPVVTPPNPAKLHPVERVRRDKFGIVGSFPLDEQDLESLVYPSLTEEEKAAVLEGLKFFTTPHTAQEGLGPFANQRFCQGCHLNSADVIRKDGDRDRERENSDRLVTTSSIASRASRSSTTNFSFTSFDPLTGGGRAPDNVDAIFNTGKTAAFTLFGDFRPSTATFSSFFTSGGVQRVRPSLEACLPDRIPLVSEDPNLAGGIDPVTFLSQSGFRRTTGERAAPPYIGRGLIEAVFDAEILANEAAQQNPINSSLDQAGDFPECGSTDCLAGRHNMNTSNQAFVGGHTDTRVGRLGLRAAGPTLMQFMIGGSQGELGFTSPLFPTEPLSTTNLNRPGCVSPPGVPNPNIPLSTPVSLRALIRLVSLPEFGKPLLHVLREKNPAKPFPKGSPEERVQRGAELFGIDLVAFANRMIPGRMPAGGDGRDQHAINQADRKLNCAGCHLPVVTTGELPAEVGAEHLSNVWVPLFSDLLIHRGPTIDAERIAPTQRLPVAVQRVDEDTGHIFVTLDLVRGMADDTLPNQGVATGREWRTPPLMGLGRIGPPFFHDGRVYLSKESVSTTPAGTVYSDSGTTNAPLVVGTLQTAIRAAIEVHDLPAPFDAPNQSTELGGGCPVVPGNRIGNVIYQNGAADICPRYESATSQQNRGDARKVIRRWRRLSEDDQLAVIEFLKQL